LQEVVFLFDKKVQETEERRNRESNGIVIVPFDFADQEPTQTLE